MRLMPPEWRAVASTVPPSAPSAPMATALHQVARFHRMFESCA